MNEELAIAIRSLLAAGLTIRDVAEQLRADPRAIEALAASSPEEAPLRRGSPATTDA